MFLKVSIVVINTPGTSWHLALEQMHSMGCWLRTSSLQNRKLYCWAGRASVAGVNSSQSWCYLKFAGSPPLMKE